MIYNNIRTAEFLERPNRFIAKIKINGKEELAHVKNTGRCRELLLPGSTVILQEFNYPNRKTKYDLISVYKGDRLINMDSQAPNKVFAEWVKTGNFIGDVTHIKQEVKFGSSRLDFYLESASNKIFVEVKGVTLEENGIVKFPDAPTERGIKHLDELCGAIKQGYQAYVVFVVQMQGVIHFKANDKTHPEFGEALRRAYNQGVHILAIDCMVTRDSICLNKEIPVLLNEK